MENNGQQKLKEKILEKIKNGQAIMRPRWQFVLITALTIFGVVFLVLFTVFLGSMIVFILSDNGSTFLPDFGLSGIGLFIASLPWLLIGAGAIFLVILEFLVRKYSFAYRRPLVFSLLTLIAVVILASIAVAQTPLHKKINSTEKFYSHYGPTKDVGFCVGTIKNLTDDGFFMESPDGSKFLVLVDEKTKFPVGVNFEEGDNVLVLGKKEDNKISANGITHANKGPMPSRKPKMPGWFRNLPSPGLK